MPTPSPRTSRRGRRHGDSALRREIEAVRDRLRALEAAARERPRPSPPDPGPGPVDDGDPWSLDPLSPLP